MRTNSLTDSMQAVVNKRLWQFVEQHGGVKKVSLKLGLVPQTLYNMRDNRSFPSAGTLALIKQQYPDTNINAFISADEPEPEPVSSTPSGADTGALQELISRQAALIEKLEAKLERIEERNERLMAALLEKTHPELFTDREGSKIGSDNHVTEFLSPIARPAPNRIGFVLG